MSPVAHTPNGDHQTYLAHLGSALDEWLRMGLLDIKRLVLDNLEHPSPEELAQASKDSQDGSVAYTLNPEKGTVTVAPAIPHTEESRAAQEAGSAAPATTTTATAGSAQLADTSTTPGASPDNPEGSSGTGVLNEDQTAGGGQGTEQGQTEQGQTPPPDGNPIPDPEEPLIP